ncbi:hypothetical protein CYY_000873 [Polysphondylium violaceum]|uniref:Folliculin n=1 Tax=Polysphondylium violaceum TaxID=133409 RepID=A0A8J4Q0R6_9MYCE|nr:hypothetical protein CYY_000873 [Polysphondylium violaceum]
MIKVKIPSFVNDNTSTTSSSSSSSSSSTIPVQDKEANGNNNNNNNTTGSYDFHQSTIVLTHFCEAHGPSVIFTTQTEFSSLPPITEQQQLNEEQQQQQQDQYKKQSLKSSINLETFNDIEMNNSKDEIVISNFTEESNSTNTIESTSTPPIQPVSLSVFFQQQQSNSNNNSNNIQDGQQYYNNHLSNRVGKQYHVLINNTKETTTTTTNTTGSKCHTCTSISQGTALLSQDLINNNVYYVSTHQPSNNSYSQIRNACVRSLSCEVVPEKEGPVFISSSEGTWLSYIFKINDSRARGLKRSYGFLFLLNESSCIINYVNWIIHCFKTLAEEIKRKSEVIYEREKSQKTHNTVVMANINRYRTINLKPLIELIEDPYFFNRLHNSFSNILSQCQAKYHLLKGSTNYILSEQHDIIKDLKKVIIKHNNINNNSSNNNSNSNSNNNSNMNSSYSSNSNNNNNNMMMMMGSLTSLLLDEALFPIKGELINSLGHIYRIVGEKGISSLIYNTIVGNQVIIRGSSKSLVESLVKTLSNLIPQECCLIDSYSDTFKELWECNILGIASDVIIPRHIDNDNTAIIDIEYYDRSNEPDDIDHPNRSTIDINETGPSFPTTMGDAIETVLRQNYPSVIESTHLKMIKDEWINKSKAFYGLKTIIENERDKRLYGFLNILNCHHPEKDRDILKFWSSCAKRSFIQMEKKT